MADGASFQIDVGVQAAGVQSAAASVDALTDRLTAAGAASTAAAQAVSDGNAAYTQAETNADRAARAVEKIGLAAQKQQALVDAANAGLQSEWSPALVAKAEALEAKLAAINARQAEAVAASNAAKAALSSEAASLDKLKASATAAATAEEQVSDQLDAAKKAAKAADDASKAAGGNGNLRELSSSLGQLGGPLGAIGQKGAAAGEAFTKMKAALGSAGPYVAVAVAIVAITTALIAATYAIASWAVGLADANRSAGLLAAGIAGTVAGGAALDATITALGHKVPLTREELSQMASDLAKSGLKGDALAKALDAAAVKAATVKFGPDFAKQMLALPQQAETLKTNLAGTFGGLKIDGLLEGFSKLVALFDSTTTSGKILKFLFETLFQPVIDGATAAIPAIERAFIQAEILALKAYIALKPYSGEIKLLAEILGGIFLAVLALVAVSIVIAFTPLAILVGAAVAVVYLLIRAVELVEDGFNALVGIGAAAGNAIKDGIGAAVSWLDSLSLSDIGSSMIEGLVAGITGAGAAVVSAITGVVGGAIDAAKSLLKINSPSKVFHAIGESTGEGMSDGVDASARDVNSSLESMVAPPAAKNGASAGASGAGITIEKIEINVTAGEGAMGIAIAVRDEVEALLKGLAMQLGGGETAHA